MNVNQHLALCVRCICLWLGVAFSTLVISCSEKDEGASGEDQLSDNPKEYNPKEQLLKENPFMAEVEFGDLPNLGLKHFELSDYLIEKPHFSSFVFKRFLYRKAIQDYKLEELTKLDENDLVEFYFIMAELERVGGDTFKLKMRGASEEVANQLLYALVKTYDTLISEARAAELAEIISKLESVLKECEKECNEAFVEVKRLATLTGDPSTPLLSDQERGGLSPLAYSLLQTKKEQNELEERVAKLQSEMLIMIFRGEQKSRLKISRDIEQTESELANRRKLFDRLLERKKEEKERQIELQKALDEWAAKKEDYLDVSRPYLKMKRRRASLKRVIYITSATWNYGLTKKMDARK